MPKDKLTNWKEVTLGDVCDIIGGGTPKTKIDEYWNGDIPWLSVVDFNNGYRTVYKAEKSITELGLQNSSTKCLDKGDIIISARGTVGALAQLGETMAFNQSCYGLKANLETTNDFLYYLVKNSIKELQNNTHGSVFDTITKDTFEKISTFLPPLLEQESIALTLSCLDDKIELNAQMNKTLEEMAQAIFKSWFVDFDPFKDGEFEDSELGKIPKGWKVGTLDEVADFSNGYAFKSKELLKTPTDDCYHIFKMGHISKGGGMNINGTKSWIKKDQCGGLLKYVLKENDLLMCMTDMKDNVALLGHTALLYENDKYILNQRVGLLRKRNDIGIDFPFLFILTNYYRFIEDLRGRANSGVQVNLSTSEIKSSLLVIPKKEINEKFDKIVKPLFSKIFKNNIETERLINLRDYLLPKLMSGEIRVPLEKK